MKALKTYFNIALMLVILVALPGAGCKPWDKICQVFNCCEKSSNCCVNQESDSQEKNTDSSIALITVDEKPVFTKNDFDNLCGSIKENNPQAKMLLEMYPKLRCELFEKEMVPAELAKIWAEKENKLEEPKLKEQIDKACKQACKDIKTRATLMALQEEVIKNLDKSDKALEEFYNNNQTIPVFQNSQFLKKPVSVNALELEFDKEEDANKFLEKAKVENADFKALAKEENKEVKELKNVSLESKDLEQNLISKLTSMKVGDINIVKLSKDKFAVVKVTERKEAEKLTYLEIKNNDQLKNTLEKVMEQHVGTKAFNDKLEEIKNKYNIKVNTEEIKKEVDEMTNAKQSQFPELEDDEEISSNIDDDEELN